MVQCCGLYLTYCFQKATHFFLLSPVLVSLLPQFHDIRGVK